MPLITCPECAKDISDLAATCPHCGFPLAAKSPSPSTTRAKKQPPTREGNIGWFDIGVLLMMAGFVCAAYFLFGYSTSVSTLFGDFTNLGLMQNRQLGLIGGVALFITGVI